MANPRGINGSDKRGRPLADLLRVELLANDQLKLRQLVSCTLQLALAGEQWAQQLVYDRIDGRVPQPVTGADGEGPVKLQISWKVSGNNELPEVEPEALPAPGNGVQLNGCKPAEQVIELTQETDADQPPV